MNIQLLIDAIVRQTTVLIAQLSTTGGVRAPLAHVANQVFLELTQELEGQGISRKVSADMFGMALRAYQRKIQRLSESSTDRGRSLWEAVLDHLSEGQVVSKTQVLARFCHDDEALVRGVLHDLTESGLVFCSGSGADAVYRVTTDQERGVLQRVRRGHDELVWAVIYREGPLTSAQLSESVRVDQDELGVTLKQLIADERVRESPDGKFEATEFFVPLEGKAGWEAAVYDHFHAVVKTMCARLDQVQEGTKADDQTGGCTYTFDVWPGHPQYSDVVGTLGELRNRLSSLRAAVRAYNQRQGMPNEQESVVVYAGQCVMPRDQALDSEKGESGDG